jgi:transposase-like protein
MTYNQLINRFPTEETCLDFFIKFRYPKGVRCNHCGAYIVNHRKAQFKAFYCYNCKNTFSPFKDTIFEKSSTDIRKWFYAIHRFQTDKKGISAVQLQYDIKVTYKTAWRMLHLIKDATNNGKNLELFDAINLCQLQR